MIEFELKNRLQWSREREEKDWEQRLPQFRFSSSRKLRGNGRRKCWRRLGSAILKRSDDLHNAFLCVSLFFDIIMLNTR